MTDHDTPPRMLLLDLTATPMPADCVEVRSNLNREKLAHIGPEGIFLWARRANTRHLLTWAEIARYAGERCDIVGAKEG